MKNFWNVVNIMGDIAKIITLIMWLILHYMLFT